MSHRRLLPAVSEMSFTPGFRSLDSELQGEELPIEGEIPEWLSGTLIRNGPGKFESGDERIRHWFDGLGLLRAYEFDTGTVRYTNRFLRTETYADAEAGELTGQFGTGQSGLPKLLSWIRRLGPPSPTDNANVHVARLAGDYVALTEVPRWTVFDPGTLETTGEFGFADLSDPDMITAHLVDDPAREEHVGHALSFGRTHEYHLFRIPDGTRRRERIATIETERPAYVHSVGVSADHIVLVETPLRINPLRAISPFTQGLLDLLEWKPDLGTTLYVVDRDSGAVVTSPTIDPFFTLHTVNAFDDGGAVVLDLVTYEDDRILEALSLDVLETEGFAGVPSGRLDRVRIDGPDVSRERRYDGGIELPAVPRAVRTRSYRYAYGQTTDRAGANGLVKVDTERGIAREWWEQDSYVGEPRIVTRPDGDREDDAVVLAPVLDTAAERSVLLVFDAGTLEELARARVPHHNPFGFHGRFFPQ